MEYIENAFDAIGLLRGSNAAVKRAALGALVGTAGITLARPSAMFVNGVPRPWSLITKNPEKSNIAPTPVPWFFVPAALAFAAGVMI